MRRPPLHEERPTVTTSSLPTAALPALARAGDAPVETPTTFEPYEVGAGITVIPTYLPVPGMGVLPAHAFVIDGPEPMIVDAGPGGGQDGFRQAVRSVVDPSSLRWLWLTHTDPDHTGSLQWLLDVAPELRVVTTFLAVGKLGMQMPVPMDRLLWVNPGSVVDLNGRRLEAMRPPSFDAPETVAFHDHTSSTLFAADSFGALLQRPSMAAGEVDPGDLADGMLLWATIDAPWVTHTDRRHFEATLGRVRGLGAERVLSSHLPPADGMVDTLVQTLARVPGTRPWIGPDQAALDQILAAVSG
jgi:glyoxylase-like metal-dependent hydrolase (beta-lactamase superfamily II)